MSRIELLPNELLLQSFQYLDARDLFHAFIDLNSRFNQLIQSFDQLQLVCHLKQWNSSKEIFPFYVYTLNIANDRLVDEIPIEQFRNIHRVKLSSISKDFLEKFNALNLPFLKELTLFPPEIFRILDPYTSLKILTLGCNNSLSFTRILSSFPDLQSLDIGLTAVYKHLEHPIVHLHLRRLILRIRSIIPSSIDKILMNYLSCTPHIEQLTIHLFLSDSGGVNSYFHYNWFQSSIEQCLPILERFHCYLYLPELHSFSRTILLKQFQENFIRAHQRYEARLFV